MYKRVITIFLLSAVLICCNERSQKDVEDTIKSSSRLMRVDRMCSDLPKPSDFQFITKTIKGNSFTANINYIYQSKKDFDDVKDYYYAWFNNNGWQKDDDMVFKFRKDNRVVAIELINFPKAKYSIYCAEIF